MDFTFLLTPPRGGRPVLKIEMNILRNNFYSRPREGGDRSASHTTSFNVGISTHAPARGATMTIVFTLPCLIAFLLTPPRGGRPIVIISQREKESISTHAPARGATQKQDRNNRKENFAFLLTPPRGGRQQFFTKTLPVFAANCRKLTRFFEGSSVMLTSNPQKACKLQGFYAPTCHEIMHGRGTR